MSIPLEILLPILPSQGARAYVEMGLLAEQLGYPGVWVPETAGPDGATLLAALAVQTTRIRLGSAILPIFTRSPVLLAQTAAALSHLSAGRFLLGLGTSSEAVVTGWHGFPFQAPLRSMREYCAILRQALSGERTSFRGQGFSSRGFRLSCPLPLPSPPIFIVALNSRMAAVAGEIGDGVILNWVVPERVRKLLEHITAGSHQAQRPTRPVIASVIWTAVDEDTAALRRWLKSSISGYMLAMEPYRQAMRDNGFATVVYQLQEAGVQGDRDGARDAIADELLEQMVMFGPLTRVQGGLQRLVAAGIERVLIMPVTAAPDSMAACRHTFKALAPLSQPLVQGQ